MKKFKLTLFGGHIVECFDNMLYGFFAVMLAPIFFPDVSERVSQLASYGAFAAGFIARPLGAAFFGFVGDKFGRRKPLLWSMAFVGLPTLVIGILPSYQVLGIFAPGMLILCRLMQGFFYGGEFTGVNLYIAENGQQETWGRQTGMLIAIGTFGAILATTVGALFSMQGMPTWAWRVPFIMGGISALFIYILRRRMPETLGFLETKKEKGLLQNPWSELVKHYKSSLMLATVIAGLTVIPMYTSTIFGNQIFKEIGFSNSESLLLNTLCLVIDAIVIILAGRLADKIGFTRHMVIGTVLTVIVPIPAFMLISHSNVSTFHVLAFVSCISIPGVLINGCAMPYIASFFPVNCRYSAVAASVTLGHALLGGPTPWVSAQLKGMYGTNIAPAYWIVLVSMIAAFGIYLREGGKQHFQKVTSEPFEFLVQ